MASLSLPETEVGSFVVPPFELVPGTLTALVLAPSWTEDDTRLFLEVVNRHAVASGIRIGMADAIGWKTAGWFDRLRRRRVDAMVAAIAMRSAADAAEVCRRCGVDPSSPFTALTWTDRKMLDLELALSSPVVITDDVGLDPTGEARVAAFLKQRLAQTNGAALVLHYPTMGLGRAPAQKAEPWSLSAIAVARRP